MIKVSRFRSCKNTPPKEDGYYLVVKCENNGNMYYASNVHYTTKYGWNTYADDISTDKASVIHVEKEKNAMWATVKDEKKR